MGYEFEALDLTQTEGISQKHYIKMYAYINSRLETRQKVFKCWYLSGFWSRFLEFIDKAFELK